MENALFIMNQYRVFKDTIESKKADFKPAFLVNY